MPRGDGTGPAGMGPMTGRAAGYCAGYSVPGFMNPIGGRGFWGRGRGGGRGWRNWYYATGLPGWARAGYGYPAWGGFMGSNATYAAPPAATFTAEQELEGLKQQAEYFQNALEEINKRIDQLAAESKKKK
jgi:hypothetical protein